MKSVIQTCVLWVSLRHLDSAAVYKCLQLPLEDYFFFIGYMSIDVPCILLKRNTYCKEDFLIPISKYCACYLTKKNHHLRFFWKKTLGSFPPLASWGPVLGMLQFASLVLGAPNWHLDSDVTSPVLHTEDYPYPRPAALVLDQLTNSSGPLVPLQHHLPFFCSLSHFSIWYHPYRSHSSMAVQRGKIRSSQHLYQLAPVSPLKTNSFWKHLQSDQLVSWRASLACTFGGTAK